MFNNQYYRRQYIIGFIVILVSSVYLFRTAKLQLATPSLREQAEKNATFCQTIYPVRGLIYDRDSTLLVYNQPIYDIQIVNKEIAKNFDTIGFCQTIGISREQFDKNISEMKKSIGYSRYKPQTFMSQLSKEDITLLQENLFRFRGIYINNRSVRDYTYNAAAHILGSVGEVTRRDIENEPYYKAGDYCGRDGIEKTYERQLRGVKGERYLMRDSKGNIQGSYKNGKEDKKAESGENIYLTLDIELQRRAEELLQGKIGSVVAIQPKTGEILALASSPTWNPKMLVGRQRGEHYRILQNDVTIPLLNRATKALYPPGSTFKTIQALVCLKEGGISLSTEYPCSGPQSTPIKCTHHHGSPVSLENAIEQSCNPYFWYAFRNTLEKDGYGSNNENFKKRYEQWRKDIMSFGLGDRFADSDVSDQAAGNIPTAESYNRAYGQKGWKAITIRSLSIGQGEILVTPLQLANQVSTIANNGYYITPHLNKAETKQLSRHETNINPTYFDVVKRGMRRVMTRGTGRRYEVPELMMCGKTGTVQNPHGADHALFIGFAPMDEPEIAIAVVVENAGFGATWAAPIASLLMEHYLTDSISRNELYNHIAQSVINENVTTWK